MKKKVYQQPVTECMEADIEQEILVASATSISTTGLDDDNLSKSSESGDSWSDAMSRRGVWDDEE